MPVLLIADIDVKDPEQYRAYREANPDIVNRFGGRYLSIGGDVKVFEGDWKPRRTVIMEFPDMAAVTAFYESEEYAAIRHIRWATADSRLVAIETLAEPVDRPGG